MMAPKQEDLLRETYEQWRLHPITKILIENLQKDKQFFVDKISLAATDPEVTDAQVRSFSIGIKNMESDLKMVVNYEIFCSKLNKK